MSAPDEPLPARHPESGLLVKLSCPKCGRKVEAAAPAEIQFVMNDWPSCCGTLMTVRLIPPGTCDIVPTH